MGDLAGPAANANGQSDVRPDAPLPPRLSGWQRAIYRVRQFTRGLTAHVSVEERRSLGRYLSPGALALFERMPVDAQRHSLNVMQTLQSGGYDDPDLMAAALLHDVGKVAADDAGVHINLWMRGPLVLAEAFVPQFLAQQANDDPRRGWRYALHVHFAHPRIGAHWAKEAGCDELVCWLIEHHQDKMSLDDDRKRLLVLLQWADEQN